MSSSFFANSNIVKKNISASFGKSTDNYAEHGVVQKKVSKILFEYTLEQIGARKVERVLEIGCGTGFLSKQLINYFKDVQYFFSDLSKEMLDANKIHVCNDSDFIYYLACDGEELPFSKNFKTNLVIASMSLHWFQDFKNSMRNLFEMTDVFAFSIPICGSFKAWALAHENLGMKNRMMKFYSESELEKILRSYKPKKFSIKIIQISHPVETALEFLRHLKFIGASPAINLHATPYKSGELKDLCKEVDNHCNDDISNYKIAICILER